MTFISFEFFLFLPVVFGGFWALGRWRFAQRAFLIASSLVFYGWADWRPCALLLGSAASAYAAGILLTRLTGPVSRRSVAVAAVAANLLSLGIFKYYDFFVTSFGGDALRLALPVGISFYTFMSISYVIDVCRGTLAAVRDPLTFFSMATFFPQILAGPIGRAPELVPQFSAGSRFDRALATDGCRQMLWGAFLKIVVADVCARHTDALFASPSQYSGATLLCGALVYAVQICADFSGYSALAIGCGKLFGIRLRRNFAAPYLAQSFSDFWRRWHMSLTTWFRDYVYIPLGGNRVSFARNVLNVWIVFLLSGLWHGAGLNFIVWGGAHALFLTGDLFRRRLLGPVREAGPLVRAGRAAVVIFGVSLAWVFFRADGLGSAVAYFAAMATNAFSPSFESPHFDLWFGVFSLFTCLTLNREHGLMLSVPWRPVRWLIYLALTFACFEKFEFSSDFVYFRF